MSFSKKVFLKHIHWFFFLESCFTLNGLQCSVSVTFVGSGKPKNLFKSLYCDVCFIAMVWNLAATVSKGCLYSKHLEGKGPSNKRTAVINMELKILIIFQMRELY